MKLIDVASAVKGADSERLGSISTSQIQRILNLGLQEIRAAVLAAGDEVVFVPGLGRFRSRMHDIKASADAEGEAEGDEPGQRRVIKFFPVREDREGRDAEGARGEQAATVVEP